MRLHSARSLSTRRPGERGIALILAIIVIFILTVLGLALLFTTTTEYQIASAETTVNRAFYAADSGVQYALAQGRLGAQAGPCTVGTTTGYWCFNVLDQATTTDTSSNPRVLNVQVTPFRLVGFQLCQGCELNLGSTQLFNVSYHFTSTAQDVNPGMSSQKTVAVDATIGPIPFSIPNH